ncbi:MAG: cell division protein SepF [Candidatus Gastranaerophilales bacterium]
MALVTEKVKSVVDFLVGGFGTGDSVWQKLAKDSEEDMMDDEFEFDGYETQNNLALKPQSSYQPINERSKDLKVVNHPNFKGYEVMVMEPRSFDDAATIVQHLRNKKTIVLNLHLLDKEQSQRTIDFVCGAAHALDGKPQKVGELVFIFTPSNVTLSIDNINENQNKFNDSLWRGPLQ